MKYPRTIREGQKLRLNCNYLYWVKGDIVYSRYDQTARNKGNQFRVYDLNNREGVGYNWRFDIVDTPIFIPIGEIEIKICRTN